MRIINLIYISNKIHIKNTDCVLLGAVAFENLDLQLKC